MGKTGQGSKNQQNWLTGFSHSDRRKRSLGPYGLERDIHGFFDGIRAVVSPVGSRKIVSADSWRATSAGERSDLKEIRSRNSGENPARIGAVKGSFGEPVRSAWKGNSEASALSAIRSRSVPFPKPSRPLARKRMGPGIGWRWTCWKHQLGACSIWWMVRCGYLSWRKPTANLDSQVICAALEKLVFSIQAPNLW